MDTNYFLKQSVKKTIFLILIVPIIIQLILINLAQSVMDIRLYYATFVFFWILYLPYFYWLSIAVNFLYTNSNHFKLKLNNFKVSLVINVVIVLNFVFFIAYIFNFVFNGGEPNDIVFLFVGLIQFVGVLSFSYTSYFVSKLILTIELKRNVYFSDIVGNLVAFSFPPLAIWIIQNKIKKMQPKNYSR
jgi:hypothetical protein